MNFFLQAPIPPPPNGQMPVSSCAQIALAVLALAAILAFALFHRNQK